MSGNVNVLFSNVIEDEKKHKPAPFPLFVPYWIIPIITLNGLSFYDLKDGEKLEKHISRDMLLDFAAINRNIFNYLFPGPKPIFGLDVIYKIKGLSDYLNSEIESRTKSVIDSLALPDGGIITEKPYRIQELDDELFLIFMEPGFTSYSFGLRDKLLEFVSECLKVQYKYSTISNVASTNMYKVYLNLLNPKYVLYFN